MSLIKEAVDDMQPVRDPELVKLAEQLAGQTTGNRGGNIPGDSDKPTKSAS